MQLIQSLIARIPSQVVLLKGRIAGAAELSAAIDDPKFSAPQCYAIYLGESGGPNLNVTNINQHITVTFGIVLAVPNLAKPTKISASGEVDDLQKYRDPVITALLGWEPLPGYDPVTFSRGRMVQAESKVLWWQDEFQTSFYRRT